MLSISKRMSEYEVGAALNLHHSAGREIFTKFYQTLENILLRFERSNTVFNAGDDLMNELFVYGKCIVLCYDHVAQPDVYGQAM